MRVREIVPVLIVLAICGAFLFGIGITTPRNLTIDTDFLNLIDKTGPTVTGVFAILIAFWAGKKAWKGVQKQIEFAESAASKEIERSRVELFDAITFDLINTSAIIGRYKRSGTLDKSACAIIDAIKIDALKASNIVGASIYVFSSEISELRRRSSAPAHTLDLKYATILQARAEALSEVVNQHSLYVQHKDEAKFKKESRILIEKVKEKYSVDEKSLHYITEIMDI